MPDEQQTHQILNMLSTTAQAINSLTQGQDAMKELVNVVYRDQQASRSSASGFELDIGLMKMRLENIEKGMHRLQHILTDDNGEKSIVNRVKALEAKAEHQEELEKVHAQGKWAMWTAIGVAVLSALATLLSPLLK